MINVCMLPATDDYDTNDIMMYAAGVTRDVAVVPSYDNRHSSRSGPGQQCFGAPKEEGRERSG
jgi:hypothetical protein